MNWYSTSKLVCAIMINIYFVHYFIRATINRWNYNRTILEDFFYSFGLFGWGWGIKGNNRSHRIWWTYILASIQIVIDGLNWPKLLPQLVQLKLHQWLFKLNPLFSLVWFISAPWLFKFQITLGTRQFSLIFFQSSTLVTVEVSFLSQLHIWW